MEIIYKKLEEVIPYEKNPRNNDSTVKYLKKSIERFGFKVPLVIDKNGVIVTGHTRYKAAKELGITEVPCIVADDLNEKQIRAFRIADNKVAEIARWNDEELRQDIIDLMSDFDMTEFGFGNFELSILLDDMEPEEYDADLISQYSRDEDSLLQNMRVIITYEDDMEEEVKKLIKENGYLKVVYRWDDLKDRI